MLKSAQTVVKLAQTTFKSAQMALKSAQSTQVGADISNVFNVWCRYPGLKPMF